MPLTVPMIEEKEFKTKVRGYDPVEVDEYLDLICDRMIEMQEEISALQAKLAQASRNLAYSQPAVVPRTAPDVSDSAQRLIANAQRTADDTIAQAKREAADIIANAKAQAELSATADLSDERLLLQNQVDELRAIARSYRAKLITLMQEQRQALDNASID